MPQKHISTLAATQTARDDSINALRLMGLPDQVRPHVNRARAEDRLTGIEQNTVCSIVPDSKRLV